MTSRKATAPAGNRRARALCALAAAVLLSALGACSLLPGTGKTDGQGDGPDACTATYSRPEVTKTVTEQKLVRAARPARGNRPAQPAEYRTESREEIVQTAETRDIAVPCPDQLTPEVIQTLQRALTARGLYSGPVNGTMGPMTRSAVQAYQRSTGLDWDVLTLKAAQNLGLVTVPVDRKV
ncbi:peptidoglycan-binding domain-containing protein [Chachezhania sediminis]|uniref:peptidoglycan-binding domain-containing protein n=1 Tax=Chachezhania sediminis TaxID=2599291 RepID=UPI00131DB672|nr:peptidoglycan-binding domain-containing protein [Chachezhania sediminis]